MGSLSTRGAWIKRHLSDPYVKRSQRENYRARSAYKLQEIDERYRILSQCKIAVDLGAAPGAWSQYLSRKMSAKPNQKAIVAVDLLPMEPLAGVQAIQGDFCELDIQNQILQKVDFRPIQLVLSDASPNLSGIRVVDDAKAANLCEHAIDFAEKVLAKNGNFICKMFQGAGFDVVFVSLKKAYGKLSVYKPNASRRESREVYLVATGKK